MTDLEIYSLAVSSINSLWFHYCNSISLYEKVDAINDLFIKLKRYPRSQSPLGALGAAKCLLLNLIRDSKKRQSTDLDEVFEQWYNNKYHPLLPSDVEFFLNSASPARRSFYFRYISKHPDSYPPEINDIIRKCFNSNR